MTQDEFLKMGWGASSKCKVIDSGEILDVVSVNFGERLIGLDRYDDIDDLAWFRCESVEVV